MTPALQREDAPRRAERPTVIAVRSIAGQPAPFLVTAARPLAEIACEALPAADALLARSGARLAVLGAAVEGADSVRHGVPS